MDPVPGGQLWRFLAACRGEDSSFFFAPNYFENEAVGIPLLFFTSGRPGGPGDFDTYISALASDGSFGPAVLVRHAPSEEPGPLSSLALRAFARVEPRLIEHRGAATLL